MYAEGTDVPPERSRTEIERVLARYGATHFGYMTAPAAAQIGFQAHGRLVRFDLPLPDRAAFRQTPTGRKRHAEAATEAAYQAEVRRRWRALALAVKAKLEAVSTRIATFEEEFLAHIVLPDGCTVASRVVPEIETAYRTGRAPALMLGAGPSVP